MKKKHQRLLLDIARYAISQALEDSTAIRPTGDGLRECRAATKGSGDGREWTRIKSPPAEGCPKGGVGCEIPNELMEKRATFVTLTIGGRLRGCIGMLEACRPLTEDVAENAIAAAFEDPRFAPLTEKEFEKLEIHISVLSLSEEMRFTSEADLLRQIRPGVDGLILQEGSRRGTFLPSVWAELPEKKLFFTHLKLKAGLPTNYWSDTLRVFRYTTDFFPA